MQNLNKFLCLDDFELVAKRRLPRPLFGYVQSGVEENWSLKSNRMAFDDLGFVTRILRSVEARETETDLFGKVWSAPFGVAPMGLLAALAFDADVSLARAAKAANIPFIQSGASLIRMEQVADANPDAWFQAYLHYDVDQIAPMLERVENAGFRTLVVTVDTPVGGNRENNIRHGFRTPLRPNVRLMWDGLIRPYWLTCVMIRTLISRGMPHFENSSHERGAPLISPRAERDYSQRGRLNWDHLRFIRDNWPGKLVLKGVLSAHDVQLAADLRVDGVILSNHGGRQLDCAVPPLLMLKDAIAAAGPMPVMIDSGFRRGSDVIKALALGAAFVFVGRPFAYAVTVGNQEGAARAIDLLTSEIDRNLALLGCTTVSQLDQSFLRPGPASHSLID